MRWLKSLPLLALVVFPGPSFSAANVWPVMPDWFWQQTSQGLLAMNVVVDRQLNNQRFICWESIADGWLTGVRIDATLTVAEIEPWRFVRLTPAVCKQLRDMP